ncbi:MAG: DUF3367 domain-containing protein [Solirubrobacteraceae bacterium]|nr:DUF3367 domain-containing protein [Solirubrobacteraceae bacterium]
MTAEHAAPAAPTGSAASAGTPGPAMPRRWLLLASLALVLLVFLQEPGRVAFETKFDLVANPGGFLLRALNLWDATAGWGQVQNQAVGYLFPMGPFFTAGHELGVPGWIIQRAWLAAILVIAMWGMARLAAALRIGGPAGWVVAGLAYALCPFVVGLVGFTSAGVLPAAVMPWAVLPLITASAGGSTRRAAGRSGLAILCMGGVNATSVITVLAVPAFYLLTRAPGRRRTALMAWWGLAVFLACFWWLAALVFQAKYGLDVTAFTETAEVTLSTTAAAEVMRGTGNWLGYLNLGEPWVQASWVLVSSAVAILATTLVACGGLAGLASTRLPERRFVLVTFGFGVIAICAGYTGQMAGLFTDQVVALIGGPLAPFRNIYKFAPLVSAGIALGLAHAVASAPPLLARAPGRARVWLPAAVVVSVLPFAALPFVQERALTRGAFKEVPGYWQEASDWLGREAPRQSTLLLPASAFGEYDWGRPLDEPMQALQQGPWVARTLQPLGGAASTRLLDAIEQLIVTQRESPGLRGALRRSGVRYVLVRNDLDWRRTASPRPIAVRDALVKAGMGRVRSFGPTLAELGTPPEFSADLGLSRRESRLRAVEIYAAAPAAKEVSTFAATRRQIVSGGPESTIQVSDWDRLRGRASVLAADLPGRAGPDDEWIVTDGLRRTRSDFGLTHDNASYTLARDELAPGTTETAQLLPPTLVGAEAVATTPRQSATVRASTYGSWLLQLPELQPVNAFDRDPATVWVAGDATTSAGQWIELEFPRPTAVDRLSVRLLREGSFRPRITSVRVTTDQGDRVTQLADGERLQQLQLAAGQTRRVRLTLERVTGERRGEVGAGLRDVFVPGVRVLRFIAPPQEPELMRAARAAGRNPTFLFTRAAADPQNLVRRDEEPQLRREFTLPVDGRMAIAARSTPRPGPALDRLLTRTRGLQVRATSTYNGLPRYRASGAFDGTRTTEWIAAPPGPRALRAPSAPGLTSTGTRSGTRRTSPVPLVTDAAPALRVRFSVRRTLTSVRVLNAGPSASRPTRLRIVAGQQTRIVNVGNERLVRFAPLRASAVTVEFVGVDRRFTTGTERVALPVGVADVDFPALRDQRVIPLPPELPIATRCGQGPDLLVDGQRIQTRVTTTAGDATAMRAAPVAPCDRATVALKAGGHELTSGGSGAFTVRDLILEPTRARIAPPRQAAAARPARGSSDRRLATVRRWDTTRRTVAVTAGPQTYLQLHQNANTGWVASMGGAPLASITLDGWQQGYVVPAGAAGTIELEFVPNRAYRGLLTVGGGLALLLLPLALLPPWRRSLRRASAPAIGPWLMGRARARWLWGAGVTVAVAAVCTPVALTVPAFVAVRTRWPVVPVLVAPAAMLAAGLCTALAGTPFSGDGRGAFGPAAQLLATLALAAVLVSLIPTASDDQGETP